MVYQIVEQAPAGDIARMIASRASRGRDLFLSRRQDIVHIGEGLYRVPSSDGRRSYTVRYGEIEECECSDYLAHRGEISCKHLSAVGVMHAARHRTRSLRTCRSCGGYGRFLWGTQDHGECRECRGTGREVR